MQPAAQMFDEGRKGGRKEGMHSVQKFKNITRY